MGRPKLKIKTKAGRNKNPKMSSRWAKGQSCLSNPESTKFRDQASSQYFHQVRRNPLLTVGNVGARGMDVESDDDDVLSADVQSLTVSDRGSAVGSFSSYKTFASDWSKCSNRAFERFLTKFKLDSALHKEMLSILAATTEVINTLGGTHKETEYFASFITTLEKCEPEQYHAMMALLSIIVGKVPESVLRKTFPQIYPKLGFILGRALESSDNTLTRVTCDVLKKILGVQECIFKEMDQEVQRIFYSVLRCALHENAKVRRKARQTIGSIMTRQKERGSDTVTRLVIGWVLDQLATFPTCGSKTAGDAIGLLQFIWTNVETISAGGAKKLYESILRVMSSGDMSIVKIGFAFFSTVFQKTLTFSSSGDSETRSFTPKLITALWDFRPDWRNGEAFIGWLRCILDGLVRLSDENLILSAPYISLLLEVISGTWPSNFGEVASKVVTEYLCHLISPDTPVENIETCFQVISKNLISIPPNENCLKVLSALLEALSPAQFSPAAREVLLQLVPLKQDEILGRFVKAFGMENLWAAVDLETRHSVILPLVRENLSGAELEFWITHVKPLLSSGRESLILLVWDSLVGFCRDPADPPNFPAELVGKTIVQSPKVRLLVLAALRQFGVWPQSRTTLQKYSKNFLPLLFNLYVTERGAVLKSKSKKVAEAEAESDEVKFTDNMGHADAVGTAIQEYLPHSDLEFVNDLIERALTKCEADGGAVEEKGPILDLIGFLSVAEINETTAEKVLTIAAGLTSDPVHMKRAYRILTSLIKNEFVWEKIQGRIAQVLRDNKGKTKSNAERFRLDCINWLVLQDDSYVEEFLPEVILNLLSVNSTARRVAVRFVTMLCDKLKENEGEKDLKTFMGVVELGLKSPSSFITASTIHFIRLVYFQLGPEQPNEGLINSCINHMFEQKDSSICREALGFLSLNLSLYRSQMGPYAASIGKILVLPGLPRKEVNKILGRMIRVFGVAGLKAVLPNSDEPKVVTRLKNLEKKLKKLKEGKKGKKGKDEEREREEDESEDESEDEPGLQLPRPARGIHRLLIKEDVVDFLDPKNMTSSLINMPKTPKGKESFEFSADGKLIITEEPKKGSAGGKEEDEEDEDSFFRKPELPGNRKRKHGGGTSVASSKRSLKSNQSLKSSRSTAGSKKSRKGSEKGVTTRPHLQAKRRKVKSSGSSVKSGRSNASRSGKHKKETFNYKK